VSTARRKGWFVVSGGPPARRRHPRLPRWRYYLRRAGLAGVLVVVVLGGSVAALAGYARYEFDKLHKDVFRNLTAPAPGSGPVTSENILIVGNNTRIGQTEGFFGTVAEDGGARSDVTMVLHLDPATRSAALLSIPRDLFVPLPKGSISGLHGKIDAALNDGPDNLVNAVSSELGIPINHYLELDFDGFQNVVNAIGGIPMDFPMLVRDSLSGLNITHTGCQMLNGAQALAVVRARHLQYYSDGQWLSDPLSDLSRIRRDQLFLRDLVDTIKAEGLNNPLTAERVLNSITNDITIDSGFSESDLLKLGSEYRNINPATVPGLTLPITTVNNYNPFGDVDFPSEPQDQQVIDQFLGSGSPPVVPGQRIEVQNVSGSYGQGLAVDDGLKAAGFTVASFTSGPTVTAPSESVIEYAPGQLAAAQGLLGRLAGAVVMYPDPALSPGTLRLQVGSVLTVAAPPSPPVATSPAGTAAAPATSTSSSPSTSPSPQVPTPGGQSTTPSVFPTQPWDPIACPPGQT
jgi:LCP family protein required for cell wall assembly